jgi:hypothetical protein
MRHRKTKVFILLSQDCPHFSANCKPQVVLPVLLHFTCAIIQGYLTPSSSGLINLLGYLTKLRRTWFDYYKEILQKTEINSQKEKMNRARYKGEVWSLHPLNTNNLYILSHLEALQTLAFWIFMEDSIYRHDWLNYSPLVINFIFSPLSLHQMLGWVGL